MPSLWSRLVRTPAAVDSDKASRSLSGQADHAEVSIDEVRSLVASVIANQHFPGRSELLAQVPALRVVGGPITFLALAVDGDNAPQSVLDHGPVPGQAWVKSDQGDPIGGLLVWVTGGLISALEYFWVTNEPPTRLPSVNQISHGPGPTTSAN
jgi:hypothetical protein